MFNYKKTAVIFSTFFVSANLYAETFTIPAFSGKLNNHSSLSSSLFEVSYNFTCGYKQSPNDFTAYCGSADYVAKVSDDGSFSVPEISFEADIDEADAGKYKMELSTSAVVSIPDTAVGYPFGFARDGLLGLLDFPENKYDKDLSKTFTVFQVNPQNIILNLSSGFDPVKWLTNIGRDLDADFYFDFTNGQATTKLFETDPRTTFFNRSMWKHNSWSEIPQQLLIVAGDWAADAIVTMKVTGLDNNATETTFPYSSIFPENSRTLSIDDTKYKDPSSLRTLTGTWVDSFLSLNYDFEDAMDSIQIQNYFTANLTCKNKKLSGEFIFRDAQYLPATELLKVPVSGSCEGESGKLAFALKKKSGEVLNLTFDVKKVLAFKKTGHGMSVMASSDVTDYDWKTGSEISSQMVLRDPSGTVSGTIYLAR